MSKLKAAMWVHGNSVRVERQRPIRVPSSIAYEDNITLLKDYSVYAEEVDCFARDVETGLNAFQNYGSGATFYSGFNVTNWFHFSFPTPVILDNTYTQLAKVFVFYKTEEWTQLTNVHIYDGPQRVKVFDGLAFAGDHSNGIDAMNCWELSPPQTIHYGLGLSVGIKFGPEGPRNPSIYFSAAGADFYTQ